MTEKDRMGEKLRDAEKAREDQYFAQRDKELIEKLRHEQDKEFNAELKAASAMTCPRCGAGLRERLEQNVRVDECAQCGGLWLDKGEFESLAHSEEGGWFGRLFRSRQEQKS